MKLKIIVPAVMAVMLILTACNTSSENLTSESPLSDALASESMSTDMKTETIDNETWYYVETEAQLRSIADSDTALAQNYIQNTNIELHQNGFLLVMMNIRLRGNTTVMATPFPVFAILLVRKNILAFSDTQRVGKCIILLLFLLIRQMQTEPTMVLS